MSVRRIEPNGRDADGRIPLRMTFGMNYRRRELGCNINASILLNPGYGVRKRAYVRGPLYLREGSRTHLLAPHISKRLGDTKTAEVRVKIWGRTGTLVDQTYTLANGTSLAIVLEDLLAEHGIGSESAPGRFLWYTLESESPNMTAYELHETPQGFVGGDHSF